MAVDLEQPQSESPQHGENRPVLLRLRDERERAEAALNDAKAKLSEIEGQIRDHCRPAIDEARRAKGKFEGTVTTEIDGVEVKSVISKRIEYDQPLIRDAADELRRQQCDVLSVIDYKLTVKERNFDKLPPEWQEILLPARIIKHAPEKIEIVVGE